MLAFNNTLPNLTQWNAVKLTAPWHF